MTLQRERQIAVGMLRRHPGWGAPRISRELAAVGYPVHPSTVSRWRVEAGLAPAKWHVTRRDRQGRQRGVELACGHLGVPPEPGAKPIALCRSCGWQPVGRPDPDRPEQPRAPEIALELTTAAPPPPDTAPPDPTPPHWIDRPAAEALRDIGEWARYGPLPSSPRERFIEVLRRGGTDREDAERIAAAAFPTRQAKRSRRRG